MKNNQLKKKQNKKLCKIHNDKIILDQKIKLSTYKSYNCTRSHHLLKNRKIEQHRLKFVKNVYELNGAYVVDRCFLKNNRVSNGGSVANFVCANQRAWATKNEIVDWLISIGVEVKKIAPEKYILKNKICFFNYIIVFANKKRVEFGLEPFYMEGVTEF